MIVRSLEEAKGFYGIGENGRLSDETVCQLREDNGGLWLSCGKGCQKHNLRYPSGAKKRTITVCGKRRTEKIFVGHKEGRGFRLEVRRRKTVFAFLTVDVIQPRQPAFLKPPTKPERIPGQAANLPKFTNNRNGRGQKA